MAPKNGDQCSRSFYPVLFANSADFSNGCANFAQKRRRLAGESWRGSCYNPILSKWIQRFSPGIVLEMSTDSEFQIRVRYIDHVTLVVRDVEASRRFYVELLGMTEVPRPAFSFGGAWFQAGATLIHLIAEHDCSGPAGYPVEVLVKSSRNHHFAFEVDDAYAAAKALKARGIPLIDDAKLRPDGAVQVFLADPDHHVVELCTSPRR